MFALNIILKIVVLPVIFLISVVEFFYDKVLKAFCILTGILFKILAICAFVAIVGKQWIALGLLPAIFAISLGILFGSGWIMGMLGSVKIRLQEVV